MADSTKVNATMIVQIIGAALLAMGMFILQDTKAEVGKLNDKISVMSLNIVSLQADMKHLHPEKLQMRVTELEFTVKDMKAKDLYQNGSNR